MRLPKVGSPLPVRLGFLLRHVVECAHAVFDDAGVARVFAQLSDELTPRVVTAV